MGRALAKRGIGLVTGGGRVGLMGSVADAALAAGGEVIGVIPEALVAWEVAHSGLTDLRVVASLASHLIVMRHGKVVEEGPAAELFKNPKSDYTRALFAAAFRIEAVPGGAAAT